MRSSGITVYTETSSDFIPFILHSEDKELFNSFYIQKTRSSSIHSTCRRQGDLLSSLQRPTTHSRHSSRKTLHRHSSSTRAFQTFQSFMTFQPYKHYYTFQHFFNQNANSTPDWFPPETPLSTSRIQDIYKHYILQRKGDVAISVILWHILQNRI